MRIIACLCFLFASVVCHADIEYVKIAENNVERQEVFYDKDGKEAYRKTLKSYGQKEITDKLTKLNNAKSTLVDIDAATYKQNAIDSKDVDLAEYTAAQTAMNS